jgi:hypothetical protein
MLPNVESQSDYIDVDQPLPFLAGFLANQYRINSEKLCMAHLLREDAYNHAKNQRRTSQKGSTKDHVSSTTGQWSGYHPINKELNTAQQPTVINPNTTPILRPDPDATDPEHTKMLSMAQKLPKFDPEVLKVVKMGKLKPTNGRSIYYGGILVKPPTSRPAPLQLSINAKNHPKLLIAQHLIKTRERVGGYPILGTKNDRDSGRFDIAAAGLSSSSSFHTADKVANIRVLFPSTGRNDPKYAQKYLKFLKVNLEFDIDLKTDEPLAPHVGDKSKGGVRATTKITTTKITTHPSSNLIWKSLTRLGLG